MSNQQLFTFGATGSLQASQAAAISK